jgi:hypothetical protein
LATYQLALDVNPSFSLAYGGMGFALAHSGRPEPGIEYTRRAIEMNPVIRPSSFGIQVWQFVIFCCRSSLTLSIGGIAHSLEKTFGGSLMPLLLQAFGSWTVLIKPNKQW